VPPATDTTADDSGQPPDEAAPPAEGPAAVPPMVTPQKGLGAFVDPGDMQVNNWSTVEFAVGLDKAALAEETEGQQLTEAHGVYLAPTMRVTLLPDPNFEAKPQSEAVQDTNPDRTATWFWKVKPLGGGDATLYARVEVGQRRADGSLAVARTYTRLVGVHVKVGTWQGFLNALKGAASLGEVLATLFGSWGKTLTALTALIAAAVGLWAAIRKLRKPKEG
jgi:hypothetical protein